VESGSGRGNLLDEAIEDVGEFDVEWPENLALLDTQGEEVVAVETVSGESTYYGSILNKYFR
jgi:hypothetical protein